jgi:hypothetical protein
VEGVALSQWAHKWCMGTCVNKDMLARVCRARLLTHRPSPCFFTLVLNKIKEVKKMWYMQMVHNLRHFD